MMDDHSASRRVDVLEHEAPHLLEPPASAGLLRAEESLRDLIAEALEQGGPTPLADALSRWRDIWPWQDRRPIERGLATSLLTLLVARQ